MMRHMSNGNPQNGSIWPVATVIVGIVALAALGWDVMLQGRVKKMEERVAQVEARARAAAAAQPKASAKPAAVTADAPATQAAPRRRGRRPSTQPATTQTATKPAQP
jgi:hypothetical protein